MKKTLVWILTLVLFLGCLPTAQAENDVSVYDVLTELIDGRTFSMVVTAEAEGTLAETIAQYGTVTCTLAQVDGQIVLRATCEGEAYLTATADAQTVSLETNLLENGTQSFDWAALEPSVKQEPGSILIQMTGPDHELIRFSCDVSGSDPEDCDLEISIGYITGPGNVHSLWDGVYTHGGEAEREFYFSYSEEEYALFGEGTALLERAEDGGLTITRDEELTVSYNDDELGTVAVHAVLTVTPQEA